MWYPFVQLSRFHCVTPRRTLEASGKHLDSCFCPICILSASIKDSTQLPCNIYNTSAHQKSNRNTNLCSPGSCWAPTTKTCHLWANLRYTLEALHSLDHLYCGLIVNTFVFQTQMTTQPTKGCDSILFFFSTEKNDATSWREGMPPQGTWACSRGVLLRTS